MIKTATMSCSLAAHSGVLLQDLASDTSCPTLNDLNPPVVTSHASQRAELVHVVSSKKGCIQQEHQGTSS